MRLKKYLGQKLRYTGKILKIDGDNMIITDIKLDGKRICDHIWASNTARMGVIIGEGVTVSFLGTATAYNRADGSRNYKIAKVHDFKDISIFEVENDNRYANKRRYRK